MGTQRAVWIDFCRAPCRDSPFHDAQHDCDIVRVTQADAIVAAVRGHRAQCACIEYDYPDQAALRAVPLVRREFPALPLLMLTEFHSEALAVWAFRSRVWDYRVKPVDAATVASLLATMARVARDGWLAAPLPNDLVAPAGHLRRPLVASRRTALAIGYISEHYAEPIRVDTLARLCHLSESEFSRSFHREHGISCRRFLLQYRIAKARDFLAEPGASVSEAAYGVGFNDLSHFGRVFRRIVGVPATAYQNGLRDDSTTAGA